MTTPRPRSPAPPDPDTQRRITALEQELARLRAGTGGAPTVEDFHSALTRITQLEADAKSRTETPPPEPPPTVDISDHSARLEAVEQAIARMQATGPTTADITALAARITEATAKEPANSPTPVPEAPPVDIGPLDARLQAVEQQAARTAALGPTDADLKALTGRVTAIEETAKTAPRTDAEERRATAEQLAGLNEKVTAALTVAGQVAGFQQLVDALARDVATLKVPGEPAPGGVSVEAHRELSGKVDDLHAILNGDPTLATAKNRTGMQVANAAIASDLDASKLVTGTVASTLYNSTVAAAINASAGGVDATKVDTGTLGAAVDVTAAWNNAGGKNASHLDTGDLAAAQMQTHFAAAFDGGASYTTTGVLRSSGLRSDAAPAGVTGTVTVTNSDNTAAVRSTGVGQILFGDTTNRDCVGFLLIRYGTASGYVPIFAAN